MSSFYLREAGSPSVLLALVWKQNPWLLRTICKEDEHLASLFRLLTVPGGDGRGNEASSSGGLIALLPVAS